jgi:hypothetical protein
MCDSSQKVFGFETGIAEPLAIREPVAPRPIKPSAELRISIALLFSVICLRRLPRSQCRARVRSHAVGVDTDGKNECD